MIKNLLCKIIGHKWEGYYALLPEGKLIAYRCERCGKEDDTYHFVPRNLIKKRSKEIKEK